MKKLIFNTIILSAATIVALPLSSCSEKAKPDEIPTTRRERNLVKEGNRQYTEKEFQKSEISYRKALAENASSDVARYNLASALSHIEGEQSHAESDSLFTDLAKTASNIDASQRSFYNLGNNSYRTEQYQQSIEMYKEALRRNPSDDNARENLRLAQLNLQEQQNQDQNQDQQDQEQEQDQEQNQNQQQEQNQQNQDQQNQDNQQDQNQDQQDQNQDQQGNKRPDEKENDKQDDKKSGMSQANAEQILKAMENEENATRRRVEAQQKAKQESQSTRRNVEKPW